LFKDFVHLLDAEVEVVVSNAGHVYVAAVKGLNHLLAFEHCADQTWTEKVTRKRSNAFNALSPCFLLVMPHGCDKTRRSTLVGLLRVFLYVVNIVEMHDAQFLVNSCLLPHTAFKVNVALLARGILVGGRTNFGLFDLLVCRTFLLRLDANHEKYL